MTCMCKCGCVLLPELPHSATGLPHRHPVSGSDSDRARAQVRQQHVLRFCQFQDHVVSYHRDEAAPEPRPLRQDVRQPGERGASGGAVGLTVVDNDYLPVGARIGRPNPTNLSTGSTDRRRDRQSRCASVRPRVSTATKSIA